MARPEPRILDVIRTQQFTPNMRRITLGGSALASFPPDQESAYIKMLFPQEGAEKLLLRTYTVRHHRDGEIDVDFVIHADGGPAANWAISTKPGDTIAVRGPGPKKLVNLDADWFLILGDMTALPAIGANIELLPDDAVGHAIIEIIDEADMQVFSPPKNFEVQWIINPHPGEKSHLLIEHVKKLPWRDGTPSVWAACEIGAMHKLRDYFRKDRQLDKHDLYISSYWKHGSSEDAHRIAKRDDAGMMKR